MCFIFHGPLHHLKLVCAASSIEEEGSDEGFPGIAPAGRGLSTMTRPTT